MADPKPPSGAEASSSTTNPEPKANPQKAAPKPPKKPNPIFKYTGLASNFQPRLPSRNWLIFLSLTSAFSAAVIYDKRETKRVQRKWCKLVEHIAKEPLDPRAMPRKLTVFLEAPPNDGLRVAQEHFKNYLKPVLVASGLDWKFVQGRVEGDVRAEVAERVRERRLPAEQRKEEEDPVVKIRKMQGTIEFEGPRGDIVIGRHTWKEYVRGLHEGWLGPLEAPKAIEVEPEKEDQNQEAAAQEPSETAKAQTQDGNPSEESAAPSSTTPEEKPSEPPSKPSQPTPFISTTSYPTAPFPTNLPSEFDPTTTIPFPHLLGFLNTPTRLTRFLNRRVLADSIGRQTAAIILSHCIPYPSTPTLYPSPESPTSTLSEQEIEQQTIIKEEEKDWPESVWKRKDGEGERVWLEPVVVDDRIAGRMRKAVLRVEDEKKASRIVVGEEEVEGWIKGGLRGLGRSAWSELGFWKVVVHKNGGGGMEGEKEG